MAVNRREAAKTAASHHTTLVLLEQAALILNSSDMHHSTHALAERLTKAIRAEQQRQLKRHDAALERVTRGVAASQPWSVKVHCSKGERELRAGLRWKDSLHGGTWEVVEPSGKRIYSPSGLGGTPNFWCKLVSGPNAYAHCAREDGCVEFCGDSIAAMLIDARGVPPCADTLAGCAPDCHEGNRCRAYGVPAPSQQEEAPADADGSGGRRG
jgi:hypothetical protein